MKRALFLASILVAGAANASAPTGCTAGTDVEPRLCPLHLPAIKSVTIDQVAIKASQSTDPAIACTDFRPDERAVRRFFAQAKEISESDARKVADWSPCYAKGSMRLADGRTVGWEIQQSGQASLYLGAQSFKYVYCPDCHFPPFAGDD